MGSVIQKTAMLLVSGDTAASFTKPNAFDVAPTPGNSGGVMISIFNATGTMTVTVGGTAAVLAHEFPRISGGINIWTQCWYVPAFGPTPNRDVVVTFSATDYKYMTYVAFECTPLADSPVDVAEGGLWTDGGGWPQVITAAAPTVQADELLLVMTMSGTGLANINLNHPPATGFTDLFFQPDSNTYQGGNAAFKLLTAIETPSASWSNTGSTSDHWDRLMVSLRFADEPAGNNGSAAITTANAAAAATGYATNVGAAALTTASTTAAATGASTNVGAAALATAGATASGSATSVNVGEAALFTDNAVVAGAGASTNVGEAHLFADQATVIGSGVSINLGNAALTTDDTTVLGFDSAVNVGNADITAQDAMGAGTGYLVNVGSAAMTLGDATASGNATSTNVGAAALTTGNVLVLGTGVSDDEQHGTAAITTANAAIAATGRLTNVANASISAANASVSAFGGQQQVVSRRIRVNFPANDKKIIISSRIRRILF
jgi:hypothetical protein